MSNGSETEDVAVAVVEVEVETAVLFIDVDISFPDDEGTGEQGLHDEHHLSCRGLYIRFLHGSSLT